MQEALAQLEQQATETMRTFTDAQGFHDYANIVRRVERAYRAVNSAYHAISKAREEVADYQRQVRGY